MSIYRSAVKKPVTTALVFVAFAIFGVFSLMKTSISQFPDFDSNVIMVMSSYQGASAQDIETNLTKVLENSLNSVANLKELTSKSRRTSPYLRLNSNMEPTSRPRPMMSATNSIWSVRPYPTEHLRR